jgi:hypothetical protein
MVEKFAQLPKDPKIWKKRSSEVLKETLNEKVVEV